MPRDRETTLKTAFASRTHHLEFPTNSFCKTVFDTRTGDGWGDRNLKIEENGIGFEKLSIAQVKPKIVHVASAPSTFQFDSDTDEFSETESTSSELSRNYTFGEVNISDSEEEGSNDEADEPVASTLSIKRPGTLEDESESESQDSSQNQEREQPKKFNTDFPPEESQEKNKILLNFRLSDLALKYDPKLTREALESPLKNPFYDFLVDEVGEAKYKFILKKYLQRPKEFAYHPVPIGIQMKCLIERKKTKISPYATYLLYLERSDKKKTLIMAARKRKKSKTGNYLITIEPGDMHRGSTNYVGKVRSNFFGTKFFIYDDGESVASKVSKELIEGYSQSIKKTTDSPCKKEKFPLRKELGLIAYNRNVLGLKGPRKMKFLIPAMINECKRLDFKPENPYESIARKRKMGNLKSKGVVELQNREPLWVDSSQTYVLNFDGRATLPSVKNFQIMDSNESNYLILQSGRIGQNHFSLDFRFPLCPLQAFGMALASFERKLACD